MKTLRVDLTDAQHQQLEDVARVMRCTSESLLLALALARLDEVSEFGQIESNDDAHLTLAYINRALLDYGHDGRIARFSVEQHLNPYGILGSTPRPGARSRSVGV